MTPLQPPMRLWVVLGWITAASALVGSGAAWVHWKQGEYLGGEVFEVSGEPWYEAIQPPFAVEDALFGLAWAAATFAVLVVLAVALEVWVRFRQRAGAA